MEKFSQRTQVLSGAGAISALQSLGATRAMVVTDPYFSGSGTAALVAKATGAQETKIFDRVTPDPEVALAAEGVEVFREFKPDLLVALGGGSAMDLAKAIAWFSRERVKLAAIPTTSGSGSEVTDFAVLTHDRVKHPLVDPSLRPDVAILDSDLLQSLPKSLIADAGFDVLAHAAEAMVATNGGAFSEIYAREAFRRAYALLPASYAGKTEVRLRIHEASAMAGVAFNAAGLGLCHAMSHSLGGLFHVPHGRLNAILLPSVIGCNAHVAAHKYGELARAAGLMGSADTVAVRNLRSGLVRLRRELHLPQTLAEAGVSPGEVWGHMEDILRATLADPCCKTNPLPVEEFQVRRILEEVTGRV